jgi:hypothetical protein
MQNDPKNYIIPESDLGVGSILYLLCGG